MSETCQSGKIPYASRGDATAAANGFRHRKGRGSRVRIYRCDCGAWHLTKMEAAEFKGRVKWQE